MLCPPPGDLPDPEIEPASPALAGRFFTTSTTWEALTGNQGSINPTQPQSLQLKGLGGSHSLSSRKDKGRLPCGTVSALSSELGESEWTCFIICKMRIMVAATWCIISPWLL